MPGFPRPFASEDATADTFDGYDEFAPDHLPEPGPFLEGTDVLTGPDHAAFHRLTRDVFEERGVYDATFGYNLARLNLDARHPNAGFRYARVEGTSDAAAAAEASTGDDQSVLLAEFTPTTEFCPQSDSLTVGAFRAWNGLRDRHEYDRVRVAVAPMHHQSTEINRKLRDLERRLHGDRSDASGGTEHTSERSAGMFGTDESTGASDDEPTAPF